MERTIFFPKNLYSFVTKNKKNIWLGLFYLSLGEELKNKPPQNLSPDKSIRIPLKDSVKCLDELVKSKRFPDYRSAILAAVFYLKEHPNLLI